MRIVGPITMFSRDEHGTVAILWGFSLVVFIGFLAMILDTGRINVTHSELQSFADNVALAAAGELDGQADAIDRATLAAASLINDTQTFANGSKALGGQASYTLSFHSDLPAQDWQAMGTGTITADPALAAFARVVVTPKIVPMMFATALSRLVGAGDDPINAQVSAEAVAGFTVDACDITPLMFCLPPGSFTAAPGAASSAIGRMIRLRSGGTGAAWGPGDFGFLDPSKADLGAQCDGLNGANLIGCLVGSELNVTKCFSQRGVDTEPGQKVGIEDAIFNVRFDIYKATMNGEKNSPDYPPAPNVISGLVPKGGGACIGNSEELSGDSVPLPRDDCFASGTCSHSNRIGNGTWATGKDNYLLVNHGLDDGGNGGTAGDGIPDSLPDMTSYFSGVPANLVNTRYGMYLAELALLDERKATVLPGETATILLDREETGLPQCNTNPSQLGARRRVLIAAGIDCVANPVVGKTKNVPVKEFFEVFLTEPVGDDGASPPTLDLWVEVVGSAGGTGYSSAGTGGIFRDVVQLYR